MNAFENSGSSITKPGNWREVSRSVGARTTGDFPLVSEGVTHETLTTLHTDLPLKADGIKAINNGSCAMNQPEMNLAYGLMEMCIVNPWNGLLLTHSERN